MASALWGRPGVASERGRGPHDPAVCGGQPAAGAPPCGPAQCNRSAVMGLGILLTVLFIPIHYNLWDKFPLWYHAAFLISLLPLTMLGAFLFVRGRRPPA